MPLWWSHLFIYFLLVSRESSAWGSMAQRQNSFEVSVKRLFLIRFICSATSKTICPRRNPKTLHSTPPSHLRDLVVVEQRCKSPQTVKKKPSGQGGGGAAGVASWGCLEVWGGGVVLGNQNDGQQWEVFCGLPRTCKVGRLVSFHSSLWSSGKHRAAEVCTASPRLTAAVCFCVCVW